MTITADWQVELPDRSLLIGSGTSYRLRVTGGFGGLFDIPAAEVTDLARSGSDGTSPSRLRSTSRMLSFRVLIDGTAAATSTSLHTLVTKWRPVTDATETPLDVRVPGSPETVMRFFGQPRDLTTDTRRFNTGTVESSAEFLALDPFAYGAEVADDGNTGTFTIAAANLGDLGADTDRVTLTINGNDGTPTLTNTTTGGTLVFDTALATGSAYVVNLHTRAVTLSGVASPGVVSATSTWFRLKGGVENSLTLTGAADVDIDYRPAFW